MNHIKRVLLVIATAIYGIFVLVYSNEDLEDEYEGWF